jgi:hypothetical protein
VDEEGRHRRVSSLGQAVSGINSASGREPDECRGRSFLEIIKGFAEGSRPTTG